MRPRRVLLLTFHFPPSAASGSFRLLGFAKYLPKLDWKVHVIAPPDLPWEPVDAKLRDQVPAEVDVRNVPYPRNAWKALRWMFQHSIWLPSAWREVQKLCNEAKPDVVVTSGPNHVIHFLGMGVKEFYRVPWAADFRDPWVNDGLGHPMTWRDRWFLFCESQVYRFADRIIANAPNAQEIYRREYPAHAHKVRMLTNGFDPNLVDEPAPPAPTEVVRLMHAGELYWGRDPMPLFDAMAAVKRNPPIPGLNLQFDIVGKSEIDRDKLDQEIAKRSLQENIVFRGQVSYQQSIREMYRSHINVLFDTPNRTFGVPAKLYEYFGGGRPILALAEKHGDTAAILKQSGLLHRVAHPKNAEEIRQALADLMIALVENKNLAPPGPPVRFTRESLTKDFVEILEDTITSATDARAMECLAM